MGTWHGIVLFGRVMRVAVTLSLLAGGLVFVRNLKQGMLPGIGADSGLLAGAGDGTGLIPGMSGGNGLLAGLKNSGRNEQSWNECALPHPGDKPALTLLHRNTRSQVESECQVRIGDGKDAVCRWLPLGDGGNTKLNAFWYPPGDGLGPCIRFQDYLNEYLIDLDKRKTYLLIRYAGQVFAGEVSESDPGYLTSSARSPNGETEIHVYVGGNEADNITHTAAASTPGTHFGVVARRNSAVLFVPASEGVFRSLSP